MAERLLFLTGRLAEPRLTRVLESLGPVDFAWEVRDVGVKVAALMTEAILKRRLEAPLPADRVVLPGRARMDLARLAAHFGVPFERGPEELSDLPAYLGRGGRPPDLSRHDIRIFCEIVDASALPTPAILSRARAMRAAGADVIDLGFLPDTPFPHLEEAVAALKSEGLAVSIDSGSPEELLRGARAGADFLLSLTEATLAEAAPTLRETGAVPILIPATHGDLDGLVAAASLAGRLGVTAILDPVLDPIHFGFAESLCRYAELRRRLPDAEILMGTGNLTELTEADSGGVTAMLLGVCSELAIRNVLVVQVSPHTRRTVEEHDAARRLMFASRADGAVPKGYGAGLAMLHDLKPFPTAPEEIARLAAEVRDRNFRIEVAADGVHVYNRDLHRRASDAFDFFPHLGVEADGAHAFYLGAELQKAEIAFALAKRYAQDEPLDWGVGAERREEDRTRLEEVGHTLKAKRRPGDAPSGDEEG